MENKKGVGTLFIIIAGLIVALLVVYLILHIPIPAFKPLKNFINYILILIIWVILQLVIVLGYYYGFKYIIKGIKLYRVTLQKKIIDVRNWFITRY